MKCPGCAAPNDAQTGLGHNDQPSAGDASVCFYCGYLGIFTGTGDEVRSPTEAELTEALAQANIVDAVLYVKSRL